MKALYFAHGNPELYDLVRGHVPSGCTLLTLDTDTVAERLEKLREAEVIVLAGAYLDRRYIAAAPRLRLVNFQGVGYHDAVDVDALAERGIALAIAPGGTGEGVSEHTIMMMLATYKRLAFVDAEIRRGVWHAHDMRTESRQLYGKTVGILGLGRIGREVARRLRAFGVELIYTDIANFPRELEEELAVRRVSFDELLARSDVLTLHVPLTPETRHLMNAVSLAQMKPGAVLINCARGPIVDSAALAAALEKGHLSGAGLDVMEVEPPAHPGPFDHFRNVVMTPHIAPGTIDAMHMKMADVFANVRRLMEGAPLADRIV
ncbi:MAG: 2-hydroxyacid dehydrogenase [Alphaproteobacteria bacterium]|nr:2-hydroxyacid dehydrogenase [Alphaproteobacteria bacterium]